MPDPALTHTPVAVRYAYRGSLVLGAVLPLVPSMFGLLPNAILAAAALFLIAAGCLLVSAASGPDGRHIRFGSAAVAAAPATLILSIKLYPAMVMFIVAPLTWLTAVWAGRPEGLGITPPWSTYPVEVVFNAGQPIAVVIAAVAAALAAFANRRQLRFAVQVFGLVVPVSLPLALVVAGTGWPTVSLATLVIGIALSVAASIETEPTWRRVASGTQGLSFVAAGAAGCLAMPATTVLALTVVTLAAAWVGWRQRLAVRVYAWFFAVEFGALAACTAVLAAGYGRAHAAFGVLGVALVALALGAAIRVNRRDEASTLAGSAHLAMVVATILTVGSPSATITLCGIWTAAVAARIWLPGVPTVDRRFLAVPAAAWATVTWWAVLGPPEVMITEEYTLPTAGVAFLVGWAIRYRYPLTRAWIAYGPAMALAVLPTASIASNTADQRRWLAVAVAVAIGVVLLVWRRRGRTATNGA